MIISIDTEIIYLMANLAQNVREELETCMNVLSPIEEHNDWNCKERDSINENILLVKKGNKQLQEMIEVFANAMRSVAQEFSNFEMINSNEYQQVETSYGAALSIPCKQSVSNISEGKTMYETAVGISQDMHVSGRIENFSLGNLTETLKVCNFSDVDFRK